MDISLQCPESSDAESHRSLPLPPQFQTHTAADVMHRAGRQRMVPALAGGVG
jgi:hypothetical protein